MLTRQGFLGLVAGVLALVIGRVFGIVELFVIGCGFVLAVIVGWIVAALSAPKLIASRSVRPTMLVARDLGRVDLRLRQTRKRRTGAFQLTERVRQPNGQTNVARLQVNSLPGKASTTAGYRLPTARRGTITVGPLIVESGDPLGVARRRRVIAGPEPITVAPRAYLIAMPQLGQGILGRQLLAQARRLGPGEFHSLREYVPGDEPRSIHWRASAGSEELLVKQHTVEGLRRLTVVLDSHIDSYLDAESFERAITVAASIIHSAHHGSLTSRFVTAGGVDLRGPDVATTTRQVLAGLDASTTPIATLERDAAEGLGLAVIVTGSKASTGWHAAQALMDPTTAMLKVFADGSATDASTVNARTDDEFLNAWRVLTGRPSNERRAGTAANATGASQEESS